MSPRFDFSQVDREFNSGDTTPANLDMFLTSVQMPVEGWITEYAVQAWNYNTGATMPLRGVLYKELLRAHLSEEVQVASSRAERRFVIPTPIRVDEGTTIRYGVWKPGASRMSYAIDENRSGAVRLLYEQNNVPELDLLGPQHIESGSAFTGYLEYTAQVAPTTGVWKAPTPEPGEPVAGTSVTLKGSTPHGGGDAAVDYTAAVQIQVFLKGAGANPDVKLVDETFTPPTSEVNAKEFTYVVSGLNVGDDVYARFRHMDSYNDWSPGWSEERSFTIADLPGKPTPLTPIGLRNSVGAITYTMRHNHPEGRTASAVQVQLKDQTGATTLWDSGMVTLGAQVSTGATITLVGNTVAGKPHPAISWATKYSWRVRVQDSIGATGPYSALADGEFRTNSTPRAPTISKPTPNDLTGDRVVEANFDDPDNDPITSAQLELTRVSNGTVIDLDPGNASSSYGMMTILANGTRGTYTIPAGNLIAGVQYRVRIRAGDGKASGYGPMSANRTFTFVVAPTLSMRVPSTVYRLNRVEEPSFERSLTDLGFWTIAGATGGSTAAREQTDDVPFGSYRMRLHKAAGSPDLSVTSWNIAVTTTATRYRLQAWIKKVVAAAGDPAANPTNAHFRLRCYDAGGVFISNVYPSTIRVANATELAPTWTNYGGRIKPSALAGTGPNWPANTTQVQIQFLLTGTTVQDAAIDAFLFEEVTDIADADWNAGVGNFFAYVDPSVPGDSPGGYEPGGAYGGGVGPWTGSEHLSWSQVLHILERNTANSALIAYAAGGAAAQQQTRPIVDRLLEDGTWERHHEGAFTANATARVSLPDNLFQNERRYRMRVQVRDTTGLDWETDWAPFVARYPGPPELAVVSFAADENRGTVTITFEPSSLPANEFGGVEIARSCKETGEKMRIVEVITNQSSTTYTYHYPVSGRTYTYYVRQIQLYGPDRIEGRWRSVDARVDYPGWNFLKSASNPAERAIAFQHRSGSGPAFPREKPNEALVPWGSSAPVVLFGEGEYRSGETSFALLPYEGRDPPERRLDVLKKLRRESGALCLLTDKPDPEKTWIALTGPMVAQRNGQLIDVSFSWMQTAYVEDAYAKLGAYSEET